jgi:hypothetical protein
MIDQIDKFILNHDLKKDAELRSKPILFTALGSEVEVSSSEIDNFIDSLKKNYHSYTEGSLEITPMGEREAIILDWLSSGRSRTAGFILKDDYQAQNALKNMTAVYFIYSPLAKKIKIGKTNTINTRFNTLSCLSPVELKLEHVLIFHKSLEIKLHKYFSDIRSHGEWFTADESLVSFISALKKGSWDRMLAELYGLV